MNFNTAVGRYDMAYLETSYLRECDTLPLTCRGNTVGPLLRSSQLLIRFIGMYACPRGVDGQSS